jgi:hypothetical protein
MSENPLAGRPYMVGEKQALSRWYDATDSAVVNEHGQKHYRVSGQIVRVGEVDLAASDYHLEEILKWTLCVASRVVSSHDEAVQPLYRNNIRTFEQRFPGAFAEYRKRFGEQGLPKTIASVTSDVPRELLGPYEPPVEPKKPDALSRREQLLRELAEIDAEATRAEVLVPHEEEPDARDEYATEGMSILEFSKVPPKARQKLLERGVATVSHLAGLPDSILPDLGPGQWVKWRLEAQQATGDPQWKQPELAA